MDLINRCMVKNNMGVITIRNFSIHMVNFFVESKESECEDKK